MGDWFTTAQAQYDNELPPYLDNEFDEDEPDDEDEEDE